MYKYRNTHVDYIAFSLGLKFQKFGTFYKALTKLDNCFNQYGFSCRLHPIS